MADRTVDILLVGGGIASATAAHTLREQGTLKNYAGASINGEYRREVDGNKKMQNMVKELKEA